ncbi:MAG: hypothetical protein A3F16_06940 [Deltaproteobacteria bacterium RIFCSPHIGHO2_12_FULL_43_9]|nr:MAG: hypothetical protein A3F16_06940 [Deltaproteobacteria bacterium RIFCSPHIGHO2_12_FULL_43_9]
MRFSWDEAKNNKLKKDLRCGLSFEKVVTLFGYRYYMDQSNDDPEQFHAIGFVEDRLITLIFEVRFDKEGEYNHLITYWPSTKAERALYEKG